MANIYKNAGINLSTTSLTTLYTVPSNRTAILKTIQVSNEHASNNLLEVSVSTQDSSAGAFGPTGITAKISGFDLLTLEKIANDLVEIMNGIEGVEDPDNGINVGADRIFIDVNQAEAIKLGLTNQDVIDNFGLAFSLLGNLGTTETLDVFIDGVNYTVDVPTDAALGPGLERLFRGVEPPADLILKRVSRLDAFSGYLFHT